MENSNVHTACIEALNDLIQINNDRIEGYERAINELDDNENGDLKNLFSTMRSESQEYKNELKTKVLEYGGEPAESTTVSGKIYRAWMDVRAAFTGGDRVTVLKSCEGGEDAAQKAYEMALEDDNVMSTTKELISRQKQALLQSHDKIKALRDAAIAADH